ncbi:unnamed protein product, partial [Urochloa humidicola]
PSPPPSFGSSARPPRRQPHVYPRSPRCRPHASASAHAPQPDLHAASLALAPDLHAAVPRLRLTTMLPAPCVHPADLEAVAPEPVGSVRFESMTVSPGGTWLMLTSAAYFKSD